MAFVVLDTTVMRNRGISPVETEFWVGLGTCARIETAMLINTSRSLNFDICPLLMLLLSYAHRYLPTPYPPDWPGAHQDDGVAATLIVCLFSTRVIGFDQSCTLS